MTGIELLIATGVVASKEIIKKSVNSLYEGVSEKTKTSIRKLKNENEIQKLYTQLSKIRKVKTLGQLDKAIDLTNFYCDSHVYIETKRLLIRDLKDFKTKGNILIEGIAGQGKSIFLRYLCSIETIKGEAIPIFAELRKIKQNETLSEFILNTLKSYKINANKDTLDDLANSGRLVLMLDAFDEVREDSKERILHELEYFSSCHENLRIIVTSRPGSGIASCSMFEVTRLSNLEKNEHESVITKITEDAELSLNLISRIKSHKGGIRQLLITPLLVTLLVIRYKSYQELPDQLSDFYDSLFQVLLQRHDGIKPGYRRLRKCNMNDYQYRKSFESFCFNAKILATDQISHEKAYQISEKSLNENTLNEDPLNFIEDIANITCLLVKDGEELRFIHKSVLEYYTACYLKDKASVNPIPVYEKLFNNKNHWRFDQELKFLKEIDKYNFQKHGSLRYLSLKFKINPNIKTNKPTKQTIKIIERELANLTATVREKDGNTFIISMMHPNFGPFNSGLFEITHKQVMTPFFTTLSPKNKNDILNADQDTQRNTNLKSLLSNHDIKVNINEASQLLANKLYKYAMEAKQNTDTTESFDADTLFQN